ncbi:MAG: hypothetical protein WC852_02630 [Candidatus Nanoarchaeia archaeon]
MKKLTQLLGAASLATAMAATSCTYITNNYETTPSQGDPAQQTQQAGNETRPHYLWSLPSQEQLAQMTPFEKLMEVARQNVRNDMTGQNDLSRIYLNGSAKADVEINGQTVHLFFPMYTDNGNGSWTYFPDSTVVNANVMIDDLTRRVANGVDLAYADYSPVSEQVAEGIERRHPGASAVRETAVPGTHLTYGDVFGFKDMEKENFLEDGAIVIMAPDESGTYAVTQLERNAIIYTPSAIRCEEVWGAGSRIFAHELIHNNTKLQGIPNLAFSDLELQAFNMSITDPNNIFLLLRHSYGQPVRDSASVYFNLDAEDMYNKLVAFDFDNYVQFNEDYLKEITPKLMEITGKYHDVLIQQAYPEYYTFEPWWLMANTFFRNDHLPLDVFAAKEFTPQNLTPAQYANLMKKEEKINALVDSVRSSYAMPAMGSFLGYVFYDGDTFEQAIVNQAKAEGFSEDEASVVLHLAMQRTFLGENGINYSAFKVSDAVTAMTEITGLFTELNGMEESWAQEIAAKEDVKQKQELYNWLSGRLNTAARYIRSSANAGRNPDVMFNPAIFDPRTDITTLYRVTPEFTDNITASPLETKTLETAAGNYRMETFDIVPDLQFSPDANGVDFVRVFHEGDSRPCIVAYASPETSGNQMLVDFGTNGLNTDGMFDASYEIDSLNQVVQLANGHAPASVDDEQEE